MKVNQIYTIINSVTSEILGKENPVNEDLSNIVDVGTEVFDATSMDNYVKSLVDHIGKVIFKSRPYTGNVPSVLMDAFEYGAVCEKVQADIPEASENDSWALEAGKSYDPNVFYKPVVSAKFFNKKVTFEVDMSFTDRQVKGSFSSANELNAFITMLYNAVDKSMTIKIDSLIMRTINNFIAETMSDAFTAETPDYTTAGNTRAVNLLKLYNDRFATQLTAEQAITNMDFIKFASMTMANYKDRMSKISTLFNIGGKERFTDDANLHVVVLSDFKNAANSYLQSDTYHNEFTALPNSESVPFWQGSGTDYSFPTISKIDVKTPEGKTVSCGGIIAVMFDTDALGVTNLDRRVTTNYNPKGEFYNNFYKFDAGYFNDLNENFVVFYVA